MPSIECGFPNEPDRLAYEGPCVWVQVGFDPNYTPEEDVLSGFSERQYLALIDTGATESCVDATLARALELPIVDSRAIVGIHGPQLTESHQAQLHIPSLGVTFDGLFAGIHLRSSGTPFFALLGRDFLGMLTMEYNGATGSVTVSPSEIAQL